MSKPLVLVILDGWGYREESSHNCIEQAHTPTMDFLYKRYPSTRIQASEEFVGLPEGQMGNSEVGHMSIGSGQVFDVDLVRINKTINQQTLDTISEIQELFQHVRQHQSTLHIMGLFSPGGIHSHSDHWYAFIKQAKDQGITNIALHLFTDGRDTTPAGSSTYIKQLEEFLEREQIGHIASIQGRYYAMDRDNNWSRTEKAGSALLSGIGEQSSDSPSTKIQDFYQEGVYDEMLPPTVFPQTNGHVSTIDTHDGILFMNFRSDRARQITQYIQDNTVDENIYLVTMTDYGDDIPTNTAFPPIEFRTTLAKELSSRGLSQAHIAETEKYAHVTYFFNGGREDPYPQENHILIDSRKDIRTHDQAPEMKAKEITDKALDQITQGTDVIVINYANADMVGHTGKVDAIKTAVETVDTELGRLFQKIHEAHGTLIVTADHGNAEKTYSLQNKQPHTAHTTNPVPFILTQDDLHLLSTGRLSDVAPTILELLELPIPESMTGISLITKDDHLSKN